jgi:hypothetical protein
MCDSYIEGRSPMKHRIYLFVLAIIVVSSFAANSIAECDLEVLASNEVSFSYPDRNPTTLNTDIISTREMTGRVLSYISEQDAYKLLDSVGAIDLEPVTNTEGLVTITFDTAFHEVREYLTGECTGIKLGPFNRTIVFFSVHNVVTNRTELAYVALLTNYPISPSVSHPNLWEINAEIEIKIENKKMKDSHGLLKYKAITKKDEFYIQFEINIPSNAEYHVNAADLKALNTLFFLFPVSPDLLNFGEWADLHRMRYRTQPGDNVKIKTKHPNGRVCFNPQSQLSGERICVNLIKDKKNKIRTAEGRIHRRNELYLEMVHF